MVLATTSGIYNFTIGYVTNIIDESQMTIREIGSKKTCNISNEMFYRIDQSHLSKYYLLEGLQYKIYCKVEKAINNVADYPTRFHSLSFDGNQCTVNLRLMFTDEITKSYTFTYSYKTTIKDIEKVLSR